ncbi:MAG: tRNA (5-methylaminomethyl-2-thiouridine)(34)-methyltransferase MnmD [Bacteroidota bacterium]|jgi:tRNA U34 5-methylaminomethyl-2-thiouridine-forming methyltransferase MnmC
MENELQLEITSDGSYTLFVPPLNEHYHSINGAIQESNHVYIDAGLLKSHQKNIYVLEIGFGTGLNAYLTYKAAQKHELNIQYTTFELYPLHPDIVRKLNYTTSDTPIEEHFFKELHQAPWSQMHQITPTYSLHKIEADFSLLNTEIKEKFDIIYFDAFAPDKQPEMWTQEIVDFLYAHTHLGGILTTYCAKGIVRRMLQHAGYTVERIPGPPGKREMLRAQRL